MTEPPRAAEDAAGRPQGLYPMLAVGLLTFSFSPILVRFASDAPGVAIAVWRTAFAVVVLAPFAIKNARADIATLSRRERLLVCVAGVLLAAHFITWIESLYLTSVASASVLVATSPIVLAALGFVFLRERLSVPVVVSILAGVAGAIIIGIGDSVPAPGSASNPALGNVLAVLATLLFSVYFIIGRVVRQRVGWLGYVFPVYLVVAITTLLIAVIRGVPLFGYPPVIYLFCAAMAIGPQIAGHGSFNFAVKYLPATLLGLLGLTEPIGASIYAALLFDERPAPLSLLGMVIVLVAVACALLFSRKSARRVVGQPPT